MSADRPRRWGDVPTRSHVNWGRNPVGPAIPAHRTSTGTESRWAGDPGAPTSAGSSSFRAGGAGPRAECTLSADPNTGADHSCRLAHTAQGESTVPAVAAVTGACAGVARESGTDRPRTRVSDPVGRWSVLLTGRTATLANRLLTLFYVLAGPTGAATTRGRSVDEPAHIQAGAVGHRHRPGAPESDIVESTVTITGGREIATYAVGDPPRDPAEYRRSGSVRCAVRGGAGHRVFAVRLTSRVRVPVADVVTNRRVDPSTAGPGARTRRHRAGSAPCAHRARTHPTAGHRRPAPVTRRVPTPDQRRRGTHIPSRPDPAGGHRQHEFGVRSPLRTAPQDRALQRRLAAIAAAEDGPTRGGIPSVGCRTRPGSA